MQRVVRGGIGIAITELTYLISKSGFHDNNEGWHLFEAPKSEVDARQRTAAHDGSFTS